MCALTYCFFQFYRNAVLFKLWGFYNVHIFLIYVYRRKTTSQGLHSHLRRTTRMITFPVTAVPRNLSLACHNQKKTELCSLSDLKKCGQVRKDKTFVVCLKTLFLKLSIIWEFIFRYGDKLHCGTSTSADVFVLLKESSLIPMRAVYSLW